MLAKRALSATPEQEFPFGVLLALCLSVGRGVFSDEPYVSKLEERLGYTAFSTMMLRKRHQ